MMTEDPHTPDVQILRAGVVAAAARPGGAGGGQALAHPARVRTSVVLAAPCGGNGRERPVADGSENERGRRAADGSGDCRGRGQRAPGPGRTRRVAAALAAKSPGAG
jgi:hypothetical protein